MILILKNKTYIKLLVCLLLLTSFSAQAQQDKAQTLSVSPTLFQMSATPLQSWTSELRVINVNDYSITIYPQVVNFAPSGENGTGSLIPIFAEETKGSTLAEWVSLSKSEIVVAPQQTVTIPFLVQIPSGAAPGGHYAAILVGTKPPQSTSKSSLVQTAQFVTSLLFVRISGDVVENGSIREFTTKKSINEVPDVHFDVRFENTGNVHLQPQGDITISNMWGTERGVIPINYQTNFGNVLPNSIRKFSFVWTGEASLYDVGRFKAIATLGYGEDVKKFTTSTTYFWIIPLKQIFIFLVIVLALIWFFTFAIKLYIRRVLTLAGLEGNLSSRTNQSKSTALNSNPETKARTVVVHKYQAAIAPMRQSILELIKNIKAAGKSREIALIIFSFFIRNKITVLFISLIVGIMLFTAWFFSETNTKIRPYDVSVVNSDNRLTISSDEIVYKSLPEYVLTAEESKIDEPPFIIELINASGEIGLAAKMRRKLEAYGYTVESITNELGRSDTKSVIIFNEENEVGALLLSKQISGALLSSDPAISASTVRVYVGTDNQ